MVSATSATIQTSCVQRSPICCVRDNLPSLVLFILRQPLFEASIGTCIPVRFVDACLDQLLLCNHTGLDRIAAFSIACITQPTRRLRFVRTARDVAFRLIGRCVVTNCHALFRVPPNKNPAPRESAGVRSHEGLQTATVDFYNVDVCYTNGRAG